MKHERLMAFFEQMLRIRLTEEAIEKLREEGEIIGSVHLSSGQEAVAIGVAAERSPQDPIFGNYRGHGWAVACGVPPEGVIAELAGRAGGVSGGRGGSAYFSAPEWGFFGENAIIGAQVPMAVGAALAARYDQSERVAITVYGDGAANQGAVSEALNMAGAWKLPVVFIVENNVYSELTPIAAMVSDPDLSRRGEPFGVPGVRVDGNDPEAVAEVAKAAINQARDGGGPSLIEAATYRIAGHYIGDAESYRDEAELDAARRVEPIVVSRARLLEAGASENSISEVEERVEGELREAVSSALASPPSDLNKIKEHLYA
jgi:pyruvate dehydrogenase E1 component alpha subunit